MATWSLLREQAILCCIDHCSCGRVLIGAVRWVSFCKCPIWTLYTVYTVYTGTLETVYLSH
jgi:hypothetical protein